jgi:Zn-dependent M28 family amino/carboxypeptidase
VQFSFKNRIRHNVEVQNVVAEIPGRDVWPDSVVMLGAHLDSWHPGTVAQDNGTGVASMLEIARAFNRWGAHLVALSALFSSVVKRKA